MDRQAQKKEVKILKAGWSAAAGQFLAPALAGDQGATVETLRRRVESGEAQLFNVLAGEYLVGAYVLKIDRRDARNEGEIIAGGGRLSGQRLLNLLPFIESQFSGVSCVRFSTSRPGMVRRAKKMGYRVAEMLMVKDIQNG